MVDFQGVSSNNSGEHLSYYDRGSNGDVDWMDWVAGFFFIIAAWFVGQILFGLGLVGAMIGDGTPEMTASLSASSDGNAALAGIGSTLMFFGVLVGVITGLVHYLGDRGKASRVLLVMSAAMTFLGLALSSFFQGDTSAINNALTTLMGRHAWLYALFLLTFPAALSGCYFAWRKIHRKALTSLHTSFSRFRWGRALQAFIITWAVLFAFSFIGGALTGNAPAWQFDPSRFFIFALISLTLLPIQSATEEIVVRGYMNKGLIQGLGNKWVAFAITSGLFTALHLANPEATSGAESGQLAIVMSGYFFFGFAACLMVLIDDGLESAIAVHAANNTFAGVFVNYEGSVLPTPSLWQVRAEPTGDSIGTILVLLAILGLLWVTRRRKVSHP